MKKSTTYFAKAFYVFLFCNSCILYANAQRREERHGQNGHADRGFSSGGRIDSRPVRPERGGFENRRPANRPPVNDIRPALHSPSPIKPAHFGGPDRNFRHSYVHVAARPTYEYCGGGYRYHSYYRAPVYSARNPGWRYAYLPARRAIITSFPFAYQTINYGGFGYRFYNGTFYRPYNNAFMVVAPPFGLFINVLPFGYRRIYVNDYPYYYYNGTYYDDYEDNYRVVAPPVGAVVESIPQGYETVVIDGETYYKVDGVQYKPVVQDNGEIWYQVIKS